MSRVEDMTKREINTTRRWGLSLFFAILVQTIGIVWWAADLSKQVEFNTFDIVEIRKEQRVYLTREQIEDIFGSRDQQIASLQTNVAGIQAALIRIEDKLDRLNR